MIRPSSIDVYIFSYIHFFIDLFEVRRILDRRIQLRSSVRSGDPNYDEGHVVDEIAFLFF